MTKSPNMRIGCTKVEKYYKFKPTTKLKLQKRFVNKIRRGLFDVGKNAIFQKSKCLDAYNKKVQMPTAHYSTSDEVYVVTRTRGTPYVCNMPDGSQIETRHRLCISSVVLWYCLNHMLLEKKKPICLLPKVSGYRMPTQDYLLSVLATQKDSYFITTYNPLPPFKASTEFYYQKIAALHACIRADLGYVAEFVHYNKNAAFYFHNLYKLARIYLHQTVEEKAIEFMPKKGIQYELGIREPKAVNPNYSKRMDKYDATDQYNHALDSLVRLLRKSIPWIRGEGAEELDGVKEAMRNMKGKLYYLTALTPFSIPTTEFEAEALSKLAKSYSIEINTNYLSWIQYAQERNVMLTHNAISMAAVDLGAYLTQKHCQISPESPTSRRTGFGRPPSHSNGIRCSQRDGYSMKTNPGTMDDEIHSQTDSVNKWLADFGLESRDALKLRDDLFFKNNPAINFCLNGENSDLLEGQLFD